jgi:hypothetical protein
VLTQVARPNPFTFGPGGPPAYDYDLDGNQIVLNQTARSSIKMLVATSPITWMSQSDRLPSSHSGVCQQLLTTTEQVYNPDTISFDTVDTGLRSDATSTPSGSDAAHNHLVRHSGERVERASSRDREERYQRFVARQRRARLSKTGAATSTLTSTNTATVILSNEQISNELELGDLAAVKIRRGVVNESPTALYQSVSFVLVQNNTLCNYSPFIGSTTDPNAPTPPPEDLPTRVRLAGRRAVPLGISGHWTGD